MQKKCRCLDKVSLRILIINSTIFCKKNVSNSHQCVLSRTKSDSFIGHKNFFSSLATVSKLFICLENPFYFINLKSNNNSFVQWKMGYIAPVSIYLFKVNNTNTKTRCNCQKVYCQLWTYFTTCSSVSIVNFEQVNVDWGTTFYFPVLLIFALQTILPFSLHGFFLLSSSQNQMISRRSARQQFQQHSERK